MNPKQAKAPSPKPAKRQLREFKFVVQPVLAIVEGDKVVGEAPSEAIVLYGIEQLRMFIDKFPDDLAELNDKGVSSG